MCWSSGERRVRERDESVRTLLINLDNGPENQSHRTQFLNRLVAFAQKYQLTVNLAYYPVSQQIQSHRTLLGHLGAALEWGCVRECGDRRPVCPDHDLEGQSARGSLAHHSLSYRCSLNQAGHGPSGNAYEALE